MQDVQRELVTHAKCMRGDSMLVRPVLRCVRGVYAGVEVGAKDVVHAMHVARPSMHHAVLESVPNSFAISTRSMRIGNATRLFRIAHFLTAASCTAVAHSHRASHMTTTSVAHQASVQLQYVHFVA